MRSLKSMVEHSCHCLSKPLCVPRINIHKYFVGSFWKGLYKNTMKCSCLGKSQERKEESQHQTADPETVMNYMCEPIDIGKVESDKSSTNVSEKTEETLEDLEHHHNDVSNIPGTQRIDMVQEELQESHDEDSDEDEEWWIPT